MTFGNLSRAGLASWAYLTVSILVLGIKLYTYWITKSQAVYSDALESFINVFAAVVSLFVIRFVQDPADEEHPYGHGKLEYFSSGFEGGLISLAALFIIAETFYAYFSGNQAQDLENGIALSFLGSILNFGLAFYLTKVGREEQSTALAASGAHVRSDVLTTLFTTLGLLAVKFTGVQVIDSVVALILAFVLARQGILIVMVSINGLLDRMNPELVKELAEAFQKSRSEGIIDIHQLKMIRSGKFHHVDAHLVVPEFWTVEKSHLVTSEYEKKVVSHYSHDGEIAFHLDPCERRYCSVCSISDCQIRVQKFQKQIAFDHGHLTGPPAQGISS